MNEQKTTRRMKSAYNEKIITGQFLNWLSNHEVVAYALGCLLLIIQPVLSLVGVFQILSSAGVSIGSTNLEGETIYNPIVYLLLISCVIGELMLVYFFCIGLEHHASKKEVDASA